MKIFLALRIWLGIGADAGARRSLACSVQAENKTSAAIVLVSCLNAFDIATSLLKQFPNRLRYSPMSRFCQVLSWRGARGESFSGKLNVKAVASMSIHPALRTANWTGREPKSEDRCS